MEACNYKEIDTTVSSDRDVKLPWKHFLRQILVCSGLWTTYFMHGLIMGAPTVVIPQLRREANSTEAVSDDMASWLSSVFGVAGLPWMFVLPILLHFKGRKILYQIVFVAAFVGFLSFYCSNTANQILISEIILSLLFVSTCYSPIIITEYSSSQYRGIFLTMKSAFFYWGMWVSNATGTYFHWKNIGILAFICSAYSTTILLWPESPYWLATIGRFEECTSSHRWLKGTGSESETELVSLLNSLKECDKLHKRPKFLSKEFIVDYLKMFCLREFYMPLLISAILYVQYFSTGKLVCSMYAIDIVKDITGSVSTAYKTMLILDGVTALGMYVGCVLSKYLKRKTLLIGSSVLGIFCLFVISLYLYLIKLSLLVENKFVTISLLTAFSVFISCGPMILSTSLYGELIPLRFKTSAMFIIAFVNSLMLTIFLKLAPSLFLMLNAHGAFMFYGVASSICLFLIYRFLPETKDKTLLEIEESFKARSKSVEENRELITIKTSDCKNFRVVPDLQ